MTDSQCQVILARHRELNQAILARHRELSEQVAVMRNDVKAILLIASAAAVYYWLVPMLQAMFG